MSYHLYVRPESLPTVDPAASYPVPRFDWVLLDASGAVIARGEGEGQSSIEQTLAQNALTNVRLIGLIPADEAVLCVAQLPARQTRYIRQALPFAVEEQLAQDIETVHLALGKRIGDSGYRVAAIDHQKMAHWFELFSGWSQLQLEALYPDASLLPIEQQEWSICLDGPVALVANRSGEWLRLQVGNLPLIADNLATGVTEEIATERVTLVGSSEDLSRHSATITALAASGTLELQQKTLEVTALELLAIAHHQRLCDPVNLCEGPYSVVDRSRSPLQPWKPAIAIACLWFLVQLGIEAGMGVYQQQQAQQFEQQAMALYQQSFPDDRRTHSGNVRRVVEGQLRQLGTSGQEADFLTLLKYVGQQYTRLPGKNAVTFNSLNYSQARGELVVDLRADSFDKLNALRGALVNTGLEADIGSVVNESSGARGRLTISGG
ncbi:type II secretion system protein GspL [Marinobacter sp. X15-166B]|uniref:type II secretion system protein GspL n=1 Tax=Marinobacter sp. X15-166B TaxID=1897620 RepID=UPI00085C0372|nr:type II secretion system protein GspL [Marinobacter sp. X15-166B]OEY67548.1 type II secretion system protein GspL [Marinobacter sp. X15-166B]